MEKDISDPCCICIIEFTTELLLKISSTSSPLTLPDPAAEVLEAIMSPDEKSQCSTPQGLKCRNHNVFESDGTPSEMVLRLENNKWTLNTNWRRMVFMGVLEQSTFKSLWLHKICKDVSGIIFVFKEEPGP